MRSGRLLFFVLFCLASCGGGSGGGTGTTTNVLSVSVGTQSACADVNVPCASVTVCVPNTSDCETIDGIDVDTGSFGLRIFSNVLALPLPNVGTDAGECAFFGSMTTWGGVVYADVKIAGEPTVTVPIQVIDPSYAGQTTTSNPCKVPVASYPSAGFNGLLGVGLGQYDCGSPCMTSTTPGQYFSCLLNTCTGTTESLSTQVANPVFLFPTDNNGAVFSWPSPPAQGTAALSGTLTFGIGTEADNEPSGVTVYETDANLDFTTVFQGHTYSQSFIDSGSNAYFFPNVQSIATCPSGGSTWYCPTSPLLETATNEGTNGSSGSVSFTIGDAGTFSVSNAVLPELGAPLAGAFDWGLPFFYGRTIYLGYENLQTPLGTGPFWAY